MLKIILLINMPGNKAYYLMGDGNTAEILVIACKSIRIVYER